MTPPMSRGFPLLHFFSTDCLPSLQLIQTVAILEGEWLVFCDSYPSDRQPVNLFLVDCLLPVSDVLAELFSLDKVLLFYLNHLKGV